MASKSGGSSQIVGFRYYMSIHMGISRGPVNELIAIKVGDIVAAEGSISDNMIFEINKPDLFGGDDKEGGIKGSIAVLMGAADQVVPSIITDTLPGPRPGWRGVMSLFYYGQVTSNNPYPKPWKMRVRRSTAGWDNNDPWYPEKCKIELSNLQVAVGIFTANPAPGDSITIGGITVFFNTHPITGADVIIGADATATATAFATFVNLNSSTLFDVTATSSGNSVELRVSHDGLPSLSQIGSVTLSLSGGDIHAMNPAHIIYECATNRAWGRGLPAALIDDAAFRATANALFDEGFGLCTRWNREDDIDKFIQTIVFHIGGVIYIDRSTGLLTLKLIRDDYDVADLPVFTYTSGLLAINEDQSSATDTSYNEIIVTYHDPILDMDGQVRAQDLASIQSLGSIISTSVEYMGCPTPDLAARLGQRDLEMQSRELRRLTVKLDRRAWNIPPGGVFRIQAPSRGIGDMVLRAGRVEDSPLTDGTITITAVEDIFSLPASSFVGIENSSWVKPDQSAHIVDVRRIEEMTWRDLSGNLTVADLSTVQVDSGAIKVLAKQPTPQSNDYAIASKIGAEAWVERGVNSWEPVFPITVALGYYDTDIVFTPNSSLIAFLAPVDLGSAVLIDNEYMRLDAVDMTAGTATVARGVADTIPAPHAAGTQMWLEDAQPAGDGREYSTGEDVSVRLLTRTSTAKLALDDAPIDVISIGGRQGRPYPPGNFKINGTRFADVDNNSAPEADVVFTWAHRDRITEGNFLLEHEADGTGPETDVTYTIRVYNGVTLLRTATGITSETWTYTNAMFITDGSISRLTFELESERDGLISWQKYHWTIFVNEAGLLQSAALVESDTFFPPTITAGGIVLAPSLVVEADTFYAPDLINRRVYPALLVDSEIFYRPTVTGGTVVLEPELLVEDDTFYTPALFSVSYILIPPLITDSDTFYAPAVVTASTQTLLPGLVTDSDTFYAPAMVGFLLPGLVTDSDTFYAPSFVFGQTLLPGLVTDTDTFYAPAAAFHSTWSPTLNFLPTASRWVFTNGNLKIDRAAGEGGNWIECLSSTPNTTGKHHIEFSVAQWPHMNSADATTAGNTGGLRVGVYDNGVTVTTNLIYPGSTTHGIGWSADGTTFQAGGLVMPAMAPNVANAIEIDFGNAKLWFGTRPYYLQWYPKLSFGGLGANITVGSTGLNIQRASGSGNWVATKALPSRSSGLLHVEFAVVGTPGSNLVVGLVNGAFDSVGTLQQPGATTTQGFGYQSNGTTYGCGGLSMPVLAAGDKVAIEVNFTTSKAWIQSSSNGKWNNDVIGNQNPATGTGGFSISTISGALFPCAAVFNTGFSTTLNGEGSFTVTPSSGFSAWNFHSDAIWWNNDVIGNQNPATNTGGISISGLTGGSAYIGAAIFRAAIGAVTAQFDVGAGFTYTMSSGYADWDT